MQVKRRLNQFFETILRKDKKLAQDEDESYSKTKKKWKGKNNKNYSQWDLVENMAEEPQEEEDAIVIANVQLQLNVVDLCEGQVSSDEEDPICKENSFGTAKSSFLRRSGTLLRKSIRRGKKKSNKDKDNQSSKEAKIEVENLTEIVEEINETLIAVAAFNRGTSSGRDDKIWEVAATKVLMEAQPSSERISREDEIFEPDTRNYEEIQSHPSKRTQSLRLGLQRRASKLASKFKRTSGSLRLKSAGSFDSIRIENSSKEKRPRSQSFTELNGIHENSKREGDAKPERSSGFRRTMSFKRVKKFMAKGVSSFGKNMMHASANLPVAFENPPATFYPEYDNHEEYHYPTELANAYYRTLSYMPKYSHDYNYGDKIRVHMQKT